MSTSDPAADGAPTRAVPLPRLVTAVVVSWLVPGSGHILLGRVGRGLLFAALLVGCYGLGLAHDGRLALRDPKQPLLSSMQVVANLGIGPLDLAARFHVYGRGAYALPRDLSNRSEDELTLIFRERTRSALSIYGTAYVWTAGLMNLLLLFDVWDIGLGRKP
jgi:hypothetical protein